MKVTVRPDGSIEVDGASPAELAAVVAALRTPVAAPWGPTPVKADSPPATDPTRAPATPVPAQKAKPESPRTRRHVPGLPPPDTRPSVGPPVPVPARALVIPKYGAFCDFVVSTLKSSPRTAARLKEAGRKAGLLIRDADLDSIASDPESGVSKTAGGEFRYSSQPRTVAHFPVLVQHWGGRGSEWATAGGTATPYSGDSRDRPKTIRRGRR